MTGKTKRASKSQQLDLCIRIACKDGITSIPAVEICGELAIHEAVSTPGAYKITHVATGCSVFRSNVTLNVARARLLRISGLNWRFDDPKDMPDSTRQALKDGWPQMGYMTDEDYAEWRRQWLAKNKT